MPYRLCLSATPVHPAIRTALLAGALCLLALGCREREIWGKAATIDPAETADEAMGDQQFAPFLENLRETPFGLAGEEHAPSLEDLQLFYRERDYRPLWFAGPVATGAARDLLELLHEADREVLGRDRYQAAEIAGRLGDEGRKVPSEEAYELETALTYVALLYASDLSVGRVRPDDLDGRWNLSADEPPDLRGWLAEAAAEGDVVASFRSLTPSHPQYERLEAARERFRGLVDAGGWPLVPTGTVVGAGEPIDPQRARALAQRLRAEGFLDAESAPAGDAATMSEALSAAVERFQESRTLDVDGRLGPETQEELNVPAIDRLRQIELNLERWRWVPSELGDPAVVVNLPAYRLDVLSAGEAALTMPVIVGKPDWPTPVFSDTIQYLVLNPYWNVPESILREEVVPAMRRDPGYVYEQQMEVLTGWGDDERPLPASAVFAGDLSGIRVRQRPGPQNPLGQIKFMFPNSENIYLHDTPADRHFSAADRYLSHGCVRVAEPIALADFLLRGDPDWNGERIAAAIARGEQRDVGLRRKVPVHLVYFTAEVDADGGLHFYEDIYGIDAAQAEAHRRADRGRGPEPTDEPAETANTAG